MLVSGFDEGELAAGDGGSVEAGPVDAGAAQAMDREMDERTTMEIHGRGAFRYIVG